MNWFINYALLFLVFIGLLRERRRTNVSLAELRARMLQVEELLIEVCFFLEESAKSRMDSSEIQSSQVLSEIEEEERISPELMEGSEAGSEVESGTAPERRLEPRLAPPELPEMEEEIKLEPKPKAVPIEARQPVGGEVESADASPPPSRSFSDNDEKDERSGGVEPSGGRNRAQTPPLNPPFGKHKRNQRIVDLFQQGMSVKEIAMRTGMGQGEVQLIIDLYSRR